VHFSDGTTYTTTFSAADWVFPAGVNGTDYFQALSPMTGRVNRNNESYDACSTTKLFDCFINLSGYTNKVVTSIYCHKTSTSQQRCAVFAVCGITAQGSPKPPVATAGTSVTGTSFQANWTPASSDPFPATSYVLDVSTDPNFGTFVGIFNNLNVGNVLTYPVPGLSSSTPYYYRVRGVNAQGQSPNSNVITVATVNPVPSPPVATAATDVEKTSFQANWTPASSDPFPATSYVLDVSTDPNFGVGTFVGIFNNYNVGNVLTYPIPGTTPQTPYYYRVRGVNAQGQSANSNVIIVTTLNIPTLSQWGLIILSFLFLSTGTIYILRRRSISA
jgi:predicted phage tail protein